MVYECTKYLVYEKAIIGKITSFMHETVNRGKK